MQVFGRGSCLPSRWTLPLMAPCLLINGVMNLPDFADPDAGAKVIRIVATPGSGDGRALATAQHIHDAIQSRGWGSGLQPFGDLNALAAWSASCPRAFSHLVCVGGDATMSATAMAAVRHRTPLLPVPSGFGNLFARTLGHTDDPDAVVRVL